MDRSGGWPAYRARLLRCAPAAVLVVALAGCTGVVRTPGVYGSKAGETAKGVLSAVQTARLAVRSATERRAFGRYLNQVLSETEADASSVQSTFDAIQPPDARSDDLRQALDGLLQQAVSTLSELRIAVRRGNDAALPGIARPLAELAQKLDDFATAHS